MAAKRNKTAAGPFAKSNRVELYGRESVVNQNGGGSSNDARRT
jgi:hypothetical protein